MLCLIQSLPQQLPSLHLHRFVLFPSFSSLSRVSSLSSVVPARLPSSGNERSQGMSPFLCLVSEELLMTSWWTTILCHEGGLVLTQALLMLISLSFLYSLYSSLMSMVFWVNRGLCLQSCDVSFIRILCHQFCTFNRRIVWGQYKFLH